LKAAVFSRYGTAEQLELVEVPTPTPNRGEVLVEVRATSINDWDLANLEGWPINRLLIGLRRPRIRVLGCDVAGRVAAVGEDVTRFSPGDRVYGDLSTSGFGTFAERVCAAETALARMPESMTFEQAAALPHAGNLAIQALFGVAQLRDGQRLLLNGAGGGVGTLAIQMARSLDVEITAVDSAHKLEALRDLGAHDVVDYERQDFTRLERRWDLIVDVKTNRPPRAYVRALREEGAYVTVGGSTPRLLQCFLRDRAIGWLGGKRLRVVALEANRDLERIGGMFESGDLAPVIDRVVDLGEIREAVVRFRHAQQTGKVVVAMRS
jgi:NADPH:quinone reductase-like Zn-dependent oxidoreductase